MCELYSQLLFNILAGNTDDHARNHASFWDGHALTLTRAYDVSAQGRRGNEATRVMLITEVDRMSRVMSAVDAAATFQLSRAQALEVARLQIEVIRTFLGGVCGEASLSEGDQDLLWRWQFINPLPSTAHPLNYWRW